MRASVPPKGVIAWGIGDQMLSSATNLIATVVAAKTLGITQLGAFSVAYATYILALGVARGLVGEPLSSRTVGRDGAPAPVADACGASLTIGVLLGIVLVVGGVMFPEPLGSAVLWMGIWMPGLLVQDAMRHAYFVSRRGRSAFLNDLLWAVAFLMSLILTRGGGSDVGVLVSSWGASATIAAIVALIGERVFPAPTRTGAWWRAHKDLGVPFVLEFFMLSGTNQAVLYGVGLAAGLAQQGALFAAVVLMGPLRVIFLGLRAVLVPEAARATSTSPATMFRVMERTALWLGLAAVAWGAVLLIIPMHIGRLLLNEVWVAAHPLVIPLTLVMVSNGSMTAYTSALRALQDSRTSLRARTASSVLILSAGLTGAAVGGANGAAWGMAISWAASAMLWRMGAARSAASSEADGSKGIVDETRGVPPDPGG